MVLKVIVGALEGLLLGLALLQVYRGSARHGATVGQNVKPTQRTAGVVLIVAGLIIAACATHSRSALAALSALTYVAIGLVVLAAKPVRKA